MEDLDALRAELTASIEAAGDLDALEEVRIDALGRKGRVTGLMKTLGGMDPEERKAAGQAFNALKDDIAEAIEARKRALTCLDGLRDIVLQGVEGLAGGLAFLGVHAAQGLHQPGDAPLAAERVDPHLLQRVEVPRGLDRGRQLGAQCVQVFHPSRLSQIKRGLPGGPPPL